MRYNNLTDKEKNALSTEFLMAQFISSVLYVKEHIGMKGLQELNKYMAKEATQAIKKSKFDALKGFAYFYKACAEKAFKSKVDLKENENKIELTHMCCASLERLKEGTERSSCCNWCIDFYKLICKDLKLSLESQLTDKGCKLIVRK